MHPLRYPSVIAAAILQRFADSRRVLRDLRRVSRVRLASVVVAFSFPRVVARVDGFFRTFSPHFPHFPRPLFAYSHMCVYAAKISSSSSSSSSSKIGRQVTPLPSHDGTTVSSTMSRARAPSSGRRDATATRRDANRMRRKVTSRRSNGSNGRIARGERERTRRQISRASNSNALVRA